MLTSLAMRLWAVGGPWANPAVGAPAVGALGGPGRRGAADPGDRG